MKVSQKHFFFSAKITFFQSNFQDQVFRKPLSLIRIYSEKKINKCSSAVKMHILMTMNQSCYFNEWLRVRSAILTLIMITMITMKICIFCLFAIFGDLI